MKTTHPFDVLFWWWLSNRILSNNSQILFCLQYGPCLFLPLLFLIITWEKKWWRMRLREITNKKKMFHDVFSHHNLNKVIAFFLSSFCGYFDCYLVVDICLLLIIIFFCQPSNQLVFINAKWQIYFIQRNNLTSCVSCELLKECHPYFFPIDFKFKFYYLINFRFFSRFFSGSQS